MTQKPSPHRVGTKRARTTVPAITEAKFQAQVSGLARVQGWLDYHTHDSRRSDPGFPDCVFVRGERVIFAELKREKGGVTSPKQKAWLAALEATGAVEAYLWKPSDWPQITKVLSRKTTRAAPSTVK